ncbi:MAG: magnesium transporter [Candidatus Diapherotrites archaeon]|nr:magnesium transporter [Candidatus Diapherotrites archaeon]
MEMEPYWSFRKIISQSLPFMILSGIGELFGGYFLSHYLEILPLVPGVFVLVPALMNVRNALDSALAARISTAMHLGVIKSRQNKEVSENVAGTVAVAIIVAVVAALSGYVVREAAGIPHVPLWGFAFISLLSLTTVAAIQSLFTVWLSFYARKHRLDPSSVVIPTLTTTGDVIVVVAVYLSVLAYLGVAG